MRQLAERYVCDRGRLVVECLSCGKRKEDAAEESNPAGTLAAVDRGLLEPARAGTARASRGFSSSPIFCNGTPTTSRCLVSTNLADATVLCTAILRFSRPRLASSSSSR